MDRYEIRVEGHLDQRRAKSLGCEELRLLPDGHSRLVFDSVDQAALYGVLTRLRDAGLELIAVERTPGPAETAAATTHPYERSKEHADALDG